MDRKETIRRYRETPRPAGIYSVRHLPTGKTLLGASPDAAAMLNRTRAQLGMQSHPNKPLQRDWDTAGEAAFEFAVIDLLPAPKDPGEDLTDDLKALLEMWQEKLQLEPGHTY